MSPERLAAVGLKSQRKWPDRGRLWAGAVATGTRPSSCRHAEPRGTGEAGLTLNDNGQIVDANVRVLSAAEIADAVSALEGAGSRRVDLIIGGSSKDGVAKVSKLEASE